MLKGFRARSIIAAVVLAGAVAALVVLASPGPASARPSYGAATGQACGVCHVNPAGGGPRTPMGQAFEAIPTYASDPAGAWAQVSGAPPPPAPAPPPPPPPPPPSPTPPLPPPVLPGAPPTSPEAAWPPVKVDVTLQQDGSMFTAVVWVRNEGDFDTDILNVKGRVPTGARYADSWAGSGRGFNAGVFDGNDVGWVNGGIKAGARQGPFVYMFDASGLAPASSASVSAWVSWAGKVPGNAVSKAAAVAVPGAVTKLEAAVGTPPPAGWKWAAAEIAAGTGEVIDGPHAHDYSWTFLVVAGSSEISTADGKKVLSSGEGVFVPARQEHTHRHLPQSRVLALHLRAADDPAGALHRGRQLFVSDTTIGVRAGVSYQLRVPEFILSPGERRPGSVTVEPNFGYVVEGTLTSEAGGSVNRFEAGKAFSLPLNTPHVDSNEGASPLRFVLVDVHPDRTLPTEGVAPSLVRVVVPDPDNLQYLNFWIALGAGFFKEEGLDVQVLTPPGPPAALQFLVQGRAEVALLAPPQYLAAIAQRQPLLIFANLLQNDPINLVVRKEVAEARKLSPTAPLAERLKGIQGLRVGVAHGPPPRLRVLFSSVGMDADRDIEMVILGEERFQAFAGNPVDALYAHTPFLEKALVEQGAVVLVDQLRGEVPELAGLNIHSLVTSRAFAAANPQALVAMTRAIYRAQQLIHSDLKASASALLRSGVPGVEQQPVETTLRLYQPAVPKTPEVAITAIERTNKYFWGPRDAPEDLSAINLSDYVAPQFALEAVGGQARAAVPAGGSGQ